MIFVTVGAQMPFDRLIQAVDRWAGLMQRNDVFAQIGTSDLQPEHLQWTARLDPIEFKAKMRDADLIISHAGMGSILTALELDRPILVLPRRGDLRETRNDHQIATAKWLSDQGTVTVAMDEHELSKRLNDIDNLTASGQIPRWASESLLSAVHDFIESDG